MSQDQEIDFAAEVVRSVRDRCLSSSDWTHSVEDRPVENKALWALYRRKLRDLPERPDFPFIDVANFPQDPYSLNPEYDKYLYVETRSTDEPAWILNQDYIEVEE
jgi:hypothetical protein